MGVVGVNKKASLQDNLKLQIEEVSLNFSGKFKKHIECSQ